MHFQRKSTHQHNIWEITFFYSCLFIISMAACVFNRKPATPIPSATQATPTTAALLGMMSSGLSERERETRAEIRAASPSCTVMLRTWTPSSSSHIPGFTCEVRADLHVLEVFVQKSCFQRRLCYPQLALYCHYDIDTSPVFVFFCAYVFSLDIDVTEHLRGILRHAQTQTHSASTEDNLSACTHCKVIVLFSLHQREHLMQRFESSQTERQK